MSYFQKYQRLTINSNCGASTDSHCGDAGNTADFRRNSDSRQSYLKAFKKYYIEKLLTQKAAQPSSSNKENCPLMDPSVTIQQSSSFYDKNEPSRSQSKHSRSGNSLLRQSVLQDKSENSRLGDCPRITRSKMEALVASNDNELEELLYSSISQLEREMMQVSQSSDLVRQNKLLRGSISKLRGLLKERLEGALKKNKEELTLMFDEYSSMIKKLLQDKQQLTSQLQNYKAKCRQEVQTRQNMENQYENKIRIIVEQNSAQISSTKQQIEEFLQIIVQYEQEANGEKEELEKLRQKVIELEMENDKLKGEESPSCIQDISDTFHQADRELERYARKIQNLLLIVDKLQEENNELNQFLKSCKCSKIKQKEPSQQSLGSALTTEEVTKNYEKQMIQAEKEFIREQMLLREAMRKKDQCIDRLNLVIQQMRKCRYQSADRLTEQALQRQTSK